MPNSPAFDIAEYLLSLPSPVVTTSTNGTLPVISVGMEPDIQDRVIVTLYDTGGPASNPAYQRDYPRFQIRVKGAKAFDYITAFNTQQTLKDLLLGIERTVISNTLYVGIWQQTEIASLASDYNNRPILVANYRTVREYSTPNRKPIE